MTGEFFQALVAVLSWFEEDIRSLKKESQTKLAESRGDKSAYAEVMQARKFLELDFGDDTPTEFSEHLLTLIESAEAIDKEMQVREAQASQIESEYGAKIQALEGNRSQLVKLAWHEDKAHATVSASSFDESQIKVLKQARAVLPLSTREQ